MKYDKLSKDELISKIEKLERELINANSNNKKSEKAENIARQQSSLLKFINSMAIPSADKSTVDEISEILLQAVKEYTGANLATFSLYLPDKKELVLLHIEAEQEILKTALKIAGDKIVKTASPVNDETYELIIKTMVATCNTFTEVSFGAIPKLIDKAIRTSTGIDRMYPIAHVIEGELFGTSMLAFKKGQTSPSIELLESYAHLMSVSLRRYNAEKALQDSEIKHRTYIEHAPLGIIIANDKGKYIDINPEASELLGYTRDELLKLSIPDVLSNEKDIDYFQKLKEKGKLSHEVKLKKKDGTVARVRLDAVLLPNHQFIAFHTDISERKKFEQELIAAKEKAEGKAAELKKQQVLFEIMFNTIKEGVVITNIKREIVLANNGMFSTFGYKPKELIGKQTKILYADTNKFNQTGNNVFNKDADDMDKQYLTFYKHKDKTIFPGETFGAKLYDHNRNWIGNIGIMRDVSEREGFITDLKIAKEKAEESDRLKSAFLANMSHEIRTPMNGILGFTTLLKEPGLSGEDQQKFIDIIEKSGDRMLSTVNDIIDISRIEASQVDIIISDINLNKQVDELFEFFLPEAKKKNLKLSLTNRIPEQQANFISDKEKLNSILTNFIKNAIKYTSTGSIKIGYSINEKGEQKELEFYVKDTGIGIPKERQNAIFNRFVQADIEDRQVFEGSGLGLAISKSYVEMLGGKIWVESEEGIGSQFYFTIPYKTNNREIQKRNTEDADKLLSVKKGLKILIVDDDEFTITYLSTILKESAKEMLIAKTGIEAVEMCHNNLNIDLVLMDIKIPGINGYEATRQIREFNKEVFILAQTAYAQAGDRKKSIQAGCDDYISKPINKEKLLEIIATHF